MAPADNPYTFLKGRILETHQLSNYEKWDQLMKVPPMGGRKPSQLLTSMLEFCPAGLERTLPFHYAFTQRLPQCLRTQLGEVEPGDPRALAARADRLWAVNTPVNTVGTPAAEPTPSALARVASGLCFFHWNWAEKATKCSPPCSWGN